MAMVKFGSLAAAALVILGCAVSREVPAAAGDPDALFVANFELVGTGGGAPPPVVAGSLCDAINSAGVVLPLGQVVAAVDAAPRPVKGIPYRDPKFNACVVRATDHANEAPSTFSRNDYSRRQAFNADSSYFLTFAINGFWHLYDARTLAHVRQLPSLAGDAEPQWHPTEAKSLFYIPNNGGTKLLKLDVVTGVSTTAADFAGKLPWAGIAHIWTKSEGSPSADGRYWCFQAEDAAYATKGVFTFDLQTGQVLGTMNTTSRPDHISMSPSGRWCVVSHLVEGGGTIAWNTNFTQSRKLHQTSEHSDIALGLDGHDVFVAVDYQSARGDMFALDIDTGVKTILFPTYVNGTATAYHVSGKSYGKPGWALVSTYASNGGSSQWLHERIFAVELKVNPQIVNIAQHHVTYSGYWTEPHAVGNRDMTRILFNSNWGTTSDTDVDAYMVQLPETAIQ